jgi:hypothetical protein
MAVKKAEPDEPADTAPATDGAPPAGAGEPVPVPADGTWSAAATASNPPADGEPDGGQVVQDADAGSEPDDGMQPAGYYRNANASGPLAVMGPQTVVIGPGRVEWVPFRILHRDLVAATEAEFAEQEKADAESARKSGDAPAPPPTAADPALAPLVPAPAEPEVPVPDQPKE